MEFEMIIMNLLNYSGEARSYSMEAIQFAKDGEVEKAKKSIEEAEQKISLAHKFQTSLIHSEAQGEKLSISLLLIHAEDHLMNAITIKDMATEFVDLYVRMSKISNGGC
ncbi:PTS system, cellobiose-specific IIA component [Proteiniborus sp. DW1]|uniref:PTS lactose/cellobiose transporter subunit IIA n=1 Tax=Proteiniborus sp. DW1 TaxID=1889883 RepID=UPI00092E06FB|nr:PTS lactose/cellobiose transporter subunit IIA [Proteiniborus sp. DW1]SCG84260.1 PTS system, cellobiose-specific IIA component [Proteiniborus sp. DW1]